MPASGPDTLLLEYFTDANLLTWQARAKDAQDYHYLWFYELESQRATHQEEILDALQTVQGISVDLSGWGRAIAYKYSDTPLSCIGSLVWVGGRFNYGKDIDASRFTPFPALYLAEDLETGLREMRGLTRNDERAGLTAAELSLCSDGCADQQRWAFENRSCYVTGFALSGLTAGMSADTLSSGV